MHILPRSLTGDNSTAGFKQETMPSTAGSNLVVLDLGFLPGKAVGGGQCSHGAPRKTTATPAFSVSYMHNARAHELDRHVWSTPIRFDNNGDRELLGGRG